MDAEKLKTILAEHAKWLAGKGGCRANLDGADLRDANLSGARYAVSVILRASWETLPDALTIELMRHDAESCGAEAMTAWAKGGSCPFLASARDFYFTEKKRALETRQAEAARSRITEGAREGKEY